MKIEMKGWIWAKPVDYSDEIKFEFSDIDYEKWAKQGYTSSTDWGAYKKICEHTIVVEVPDQLDAVAMKIDSLERKRTALRAEFTLRLNEINDQISKLTAIEYTPATVVEPA